MEADLTSNLILFRHEDLNKILILRIFDFQAFLRTKICRN